MVKFAEAEKRRGGDGGDRKLGVVAMLERPKMSRGMWESLKAHIMRERRRKKEELEADEEEKRIRKEKENRKKQHAMTLEETREQIAKEQEKLTNLQSQKHNLVQQLKKVLNEENEKKEQEKKKEEQQQQQHIQQLQQPSYPKETDIVPVHPYGHNTVPLTGHPQMMFPGGMVPGRGTNIPLYKMPASQSMAMPSSSVKRPRSPSPPPHNYQQIPYVFKNIPGTQTSVVPVSISSSSHVPGLHTSLEHKKPSSLSVRQNFGPPQSDDKFYNAGVRSHLVLHSGSVMPPSSSVGGKPPAMSAFPVRGPTSTTAGHSGVSSSHAYSGLNLSRSYY